jgi:hydroxymethylbilane synthase
LKDLPTELSDEFEICAIPPREDSRDSLCSVKYSSLEELPQNAHVGTSSLRREAQLRVLRSDIQIHPLRGNVDTRLRKLQSGEYDAIILAIAGLRRLGRTELVRQVLPVEVMCPAAGQGALAVEIRTGDADVCRLLKFLDDSAARAETDCERALLERMGGGCQVPIGASATFVFGNLQLQAIVASPDGSRVLRESGSGKDPHKLGKSIAEALLDRGGAEILKAIYGAPTAVPQQP